MHSCSTLQPFGEKLEQENDPDKKAMYKRMKESITTGVTEMEKTVNNNVDDATLAQAKQVLFHHHYPKYLDKLSALAHGLYTYIKSCNL